ncbi:MAG: CPBP family intramembrane metalloprotease [Oscillospiraceae bacterium]|nr:CPBP family intramembrane metalloprotease [Oscillospiraceae bacterium]
MEQTKKHVPLSVLLVYFLLFSGAWTAAELLLKDRLFPENAVLMTLMRDGILKNLIWTLPAVLLVRRYADCMLVRLKEMFTNKIPWGRLLAALAAVTAYLLFSAYRTHGRLAVQPSFGLDKLLIVLFVGITEEMVFRGWLLNATARHDDDFIAMGINALMFLCIHFPIWIHDGKFVHTMTHLGFVMIIILSFMFSTVFLKTKNLLAPILLHMLWDLLVFMFC